MTSSAANPGLPPTPDRFVVHAWDDRVVESLGFPVNSIYTETVILPVLGPSATWCLRRLGAWAEAHPNGIEIETLELARDLGLGTNLGRNAAINRTLNRLCQFDMAHWSSGDWLAVRTSVAPLPERQLSRLSPAVVQVHRALVEESGLSRLRAAGMIPAAGPPMPSAADRAPSNGLGVGM